MSAVEFTTEQHDQLLEALTRATFNFLFANDGNEELFIEYCDHEPTFDKFVKDAIGNYCDEDIRANAAAAKTYIYDNALDNQALGAAHLRLPNFQTPPNPFSDEGFELDE